MMESQLALRALQMQMRVFQENGYTGDWWGPVESLYDNLFELFTDYEEAKLDNNQTKMDTLQELMQPLARRAFGLIEVIDIPKKGDSTC